MSGGERVELYTRVPHRVQRAVTAHELTFNEYGVLVWLIYRCWRDGGTTAATLSSIHEEMRWPHTTEALRQALHRLAEKGWVESEPPSRGGRSPWRWSLKSAQIEPHHLVVTSNEGAAEVVDFPMTKRLGDPSDLQRSSSPKERKDRKGSALRGDEPPQLRCPRCHVPLYTERQVAEHLVNVHLEEPA
jgi:hypothetical protein